MQLAALRDNNTPFVDHGIEVLYRFAAFDPFCRTRFFGRPFDLGQFERFRRIMHTPHYCVLLGYTEHQLLSSLQVSELRWKQRVWVKGYRTNTEGVFEFSMIQRLGGRYDGIWFCDALLCDDCDERTLIV
ncbi:hypothetical protein WJX72_000145 [[Myrmecia] bisecta]|uniref:Uncharacterized protein n=1 Tax=[Myrmecia] bisecta TaxID=41462 RepID=A0AAW1PVW1_9CHLO